jgi:predicted amidohydrolase
VAGEEVFQAPKEAESALVHLYLRFSAGGSVVWDAVELSEVAPAPMPRATVATVRWRPAHPSTPEKNREFWAGLLDRAGAQKVDLVCLPEAMNQASLSAPLDELAEAIPGPTFNMLAEKARQHAMNVCGCFYERQGDFIFNTAVLVNRRGEMIGKYRKVHPYWPEEPDGCSPGDDLPVFESDVGRIGIMICYDSWFPETARLLALKGAEIILFPNAGYELKIIPARAIDNDVYVVVASLASPGVIVDTCGNMLAETTTDGLITASIIPRHRPTPHANAGGTLNASPGGRRGTRNAASLRLYDEIRAEIARWESPCK